MTEDSDVCAGFCVCSHVHDREDGAKYILGQIIRLASIEGECGRERKNEGKQERGRNRQIQRSEVFG